MTRFWLTITTLFWVAFLPDLKALGNAGVNTKGHVIRVLVVTGGHDFEREPFFAMFQAMPGIQWREAIQPAANDLYAEDEAKKYDVIVLYDMVQTITENQKQNLVRLLKEQGKGLVGLHHCIVDYQDWPEFRRILGGRYYFPSEPKKGWSSSRASSTTTRNSQCRSPTLCTRSRRD